MGTRILILACLAACAGPSVTVDGVAVASSPVPGHVRVTATLHNASGHGNVELHVTLRGPERIDWDGQAEVDGTESRVLVIDIAAPPGAYTARITTKYPH
jgi:hypothetical protein